MLTKEGWKSFEETHGWREVVDTVKERMSIIMRDLLSSDVCDSNEKRIEFQTEYKTCLWFINLPRIDERVIKPKEREEDEAEKDRSLAPDLEPFKR